MKKLWGLIVFALIVFGLMGTGWWLIQRKPGRPPLETDQPLFRVEALSSGKLIEVQPGTPPIRSLRWLKPLAGGFSIAQVITQSNRQQLSLFQDGDFKTSFTVPKPPSVSEGFFNFADVGAVVLIPNELIVLLYRSPTGNDETPVVIAYDLQAQHIRWSHRALGERLILSGEAKPSAVFLFGAQGPVLRLPLALQRGEKNNRQGMRSAIQTIELPLEVKDISDLLPTGGWGFLIAHSQGLSAYLGSSDKGWKHVPAPTPSSLGFPEPKGTLARSGNAYWWQPEPGFLFQVKANGETTGQIDLTTMLTGDPLERDVQLLRLMGSDREGHLWFALAKPTLQTPKMALKDPNATNPHEPGKETDPPTPVNDPVEEAAWREPWEAHMKAGIDRLYRWKPKGQILEVLQWSDQWEKLSPPKGFDKPTENILFVPIAGGFLFSADQRRWWLPIKLLPLSRR